MPLRERLGEALFFLLEHARDVRLACDELRDRRSPISVAERGDQLVEERSA